MLASLIDLLPLILGAAMLPLWVVMSLLLLRGAGGMRKATAFAAGAMAVRLLQGILFGFVFGTTAGANGDDGSSIVASTLLLVVGVVLLATAVRQWHKDEDPDAPPPPWMATLGTVSSVKAFGIGALLMTIAVKQWVVTLAAIAVLEDVMVERLRAAGVEAIAGRRVKLDDPGLPEASFASTVVGTGAEGLLMVTLLGVDTRTQVSTTMVSGGQSWGRGPWGGPPTGP